MNSLENNLLTTTPLNVTSQPFTRVELVRKYEELPVSEALDQLPSDMAYQREWVVRLESSVDVAKAALERVELTASVDWRPHFPIHTKPTVGERDSKAKLLALGSSELTTWEAKKLDLKLARSALEYMEDKFIAVRKLYETPPK